MIQSNTQPLHPGNPDNGTPRAILFICSMNAIRSPMAAAITRTLFPKGVYARSAGIHKGEKDPFVATVMSEVGIDMSTHYPHTFEELGDQNFEVTIALTDEANKHAETLLSTNASNLEFWPLSDPTLENGPREQRLFAYRAVRDTLITRIKERFGWQISP